MKLLVKVLRSSSAVSHRGIGFELTLKLKHIVLECMSRWEKDSLSCPFIFCISVFSLFDISYSQRSNMYSTFNFYQQDRQSTALTAWYSGIMT